MQKTSPGPAKQTLFLTKIILTILVLSVLIFINFIDLQENNNNRGYLNMLKDIVERTHRSELDFKDYELKRVDTLKQISAEIFEKHHNSRVQLVSILNEYGAFITNASKGGEKNRGNKIILMTNPPLESTLKSNENIFLSRDRGEAQYQGSNTEVNINQAIDIFNTYPAEEEVTLISNIDTLALRQKCDSIYNEINQRQKLAADLRDSLQRERPTTITGNGRNVSGPIDNDGTGGPTTYRDERSGATVEVAEKNSLFGVYQTFYALYIYNDELNVLIIDRKNNGSDPDFGGQGSGAQGTQANSRPSAKRYVLRIPAKTSKVNFPSNLVIAGYPGKTCNELIDKSKQKELRNLYGNAKLSMIDNISVDIYKKNNEPISILGFNLSRKWFPLALCVVLTGISLLLYNTTRKYKNAETIFTTSSDEDAMAFIVSNKLSRFFLWVITPPLIFFFVLYSSFIQYSIFFTLMFWACCLTCVLFGILSFIFSARSNKRVLQT